MLRLGQIDTREVASIEHDALSAHAAEILVAKIAVIEFSIDFVICVHEAQRIPATGSVIGTVPMTSLSGT